MDDLKATTRQGKGAGGSRGISTTRKALTPVKTQRRVKFDVDSGVVLLGLDVSSITTGYCFIDTNGNILKAGAIKCGGDVPERMQQLRDSLALLLNEQKPTFVAIEDMIAFRNGRVVKLINQFVGVAYLTAFDFNGNDVYFIASSSVKKMLGVNPRALRKDGLKPDQIKAVVYDNVAKKYGLKTEPADEKVRFDIADAAGVAFKLLEKVRGA